MASTPALAKQYLIHMDGHLKARNPQIQLWENYFEGVHRLQFATSRFRATFGNLFREFADNWCELVVVASVERLVINGFRTASGSKDDSGALMDLWRDNYLDADSRIAHTEAVKLGHSYVLIDPDGNTAAGTESPLITVEHPSQAIVMHDPANARNRIAALKEFVAEDGRVCATVYLPDATYRFEAVEKGHREPRNGLQVSGLAYPTDYLQAPSSTTGAGPEIDWVARKGVEFVTANRLGVVSMVPLRNNPTLAVGGRSDIAIVIPIQDAINKILADMVIASEFSSFMQRWVTGIEIPKDPQTGKPMSTDSFLASVARIWAVEDPDAKFGQFEASDLGNYVKALEMLIQHLAAVTRTPPHYLLGQSGNFPSGDSLSSTETGLVAKTRAKQADFGPSWGEVMTLGKRAKGEKPERVQVLWGDPEQRIRSQRIDGAVKMSTLGVPQDSLWAEMGYTPEDIERMHEEKKQMGQDAYSTEFGVPPTPEVEMVDGPEGNLHQQQAASQATRVARIQN